MEGKELLKRLLISYPIIYGGGMMATWLCCMIYSPDSVFSLEYFGWMFVIALLGDLPCLIFYSRKELTAKQWTNRWLIHLALLEGILLIVGYYLELYEGIMQGVVFGISVLLVYVIVRVLCFTGDFFEANQINEQLKKIKKNK